MNLELQVFEKCQVRDPIKHLSMKYPSTIILGRYALSPELLAESECLLQEKAVTFESIDIHQHVSFDIDTKEAELLGTKLSELQPKWMYLAPCYLFLKSNLNACWYKLKEMVHAHIQSFRTSQESLVEPILQQVFFN